MKLLMYNILPRGACPNCGHTKFVVETIERNRYLTNRDGEIIDHQEIYNTAVGMCCKCGKVYEMLQEPEGFIPLTALRKIIMVQPEKPKYKDFFIPNPMEIKDNDNGES